MLDMPAIPIFEPDGFLRLERFAQHPVREDRIGHDGEEDFLGQLKEVRLCKGGAGDECSAQAVSAVFEGTPVVFLGDERDVVDEHEVEEGVDELCAVGSIVSVSANRVDCKRCCGL